MVKDVWTCSLYLMWRVCTRTIREENCIVNKQNISGKNFGFHSFTDSERVVCDHIYIFAHHYHQCHQQLCDIFTFLLIIIIIIINVINSCVITFTFLLIIFIINVINSCVITFTFLLIIIIINIINNCWRMVDFLISWKGGGLKLNQSLPSCMTWSLGQDSPLIKEAEL
jgi:hypothetical protein